MKEYGLIGRHIGHSFSGNYFNKKFAEEEIDARYSLFDLEEVGEIRNVLENHPDLAGLNVTSPYKRDIFPYLDEITPAASEIGAVNVVEFRKEDGKICLIGHNTDYEGFRSTLAPLSLPKGTKALVLGSGGASSAVCYALSRENIPYKVVSRNPVEDQISYEEASDLIPTHKLIVNATPLGMEKNIGVAPPVDYGKITGGHVLYDLIYNPAETEFLKRGRETGAVTKNGLDMLIRQAELSWQIWNGNVLRE